MQKNTPKLLFFLAIFLCLIQTSFISCSQDEDLIDLVGLEDPDEETIDGSDGNNDGDSDGSDDQETPDLGETDNGPDFDSSEGLKIDNTPCDYTLDSIESNSTLEIACRMDLGGQTVTVPSGVSFVFAGGEIINGTLNFSAQGTIDGGLLNKDLTIEGDVVLISEQFNFYPERWGIYQGQVQQNEALYNGVTLQKVIDLTNSLGASVFNIDALNAYFYRESLWEHPADLPSNFHLRMTSNTNLRVYPSSNNWSNRIILIQDVDNVKVTGGNLWGDRDEHSGGYPTNQSHLIHIRSGHGVLIEGVKFFNSIVDGMQIESSKHAYESSYDPSSDIIVRGCEFDSNRRINLSITDGRDILVEDCLFLNAGVDTNGSSGIEPRFGIDVEPLTVDVNRPQQIVERVTFRNNVERGSFRGSMVLADGDNITVEGNDFQNFMAYSAASNVKILNNTLFQIHAGKEEDWYSRSRNENTVISGNTINGNGQVGIIAVHQDIQITDNTFNNCSIGVQMKGLIDSSIKNNDFQNPNDNSSIAITALFFLDNIDISNNNINVGGRSFRFGYVNNDSEYSNYSFSVNDNTINSGDIAYFNNTSGVSVNNNIFTYGIRIVGGNNLEFNNNEITTSGPFGFEIRESTLSNLSITNNTIDTSGNTGYSPGIISKYANGSSNSNILIEGNTFRVSGYNNGISIDGYHNISVLNNVGISPTNALIKYTGNNSVFNGNSLLSGANGGLYDIQGSGNTIN